MLEILINSATITVFVMLMMIIIEFVNTQTRGRWAEPLKKNKGLQIVVAALLGAIPGCLGVYTIVSLFTHRLISFGALVSAMIATSGDEAFVMLAMMPQQAVLLSVFIFIVAIATGFLTNILYKGTSFSKNNQHSFHLHQHEATQDIQEFKSNLTKNAFFNPLRWKLLTLLFLFVTALFWGNAQHQHQHHIIPNMSQLTETKVKQGEANCSNEHEHEHEHEHTQEHSLQYGGTHNNTHEHTHTHSDTHEHEEDNSSWFNFANILFFIITAICLWIVLTASHHFLDIHIWHHVIKKHFFKIFLWTLGTLLFIYALQHYIEFDILAFAQKNKWLILLVAILVGIIPESGPHMVFISLFLSGIIPLSVLMANSIVQDGHGALPLFAENKKAFLHMKIMNMGTALVWGGLGLLLGF